MLLSFFAVTATCTPNPTPKVRAVERVRAFIAAVNARDETAVGRLLAPGATYSNLQVQGISLAAVMTDLITTPQAERLNIDSATLQGNAVLLHTRTPGGATATAMVRLTGGCIRTFNQVR